jgi:8-oxo-dGTP pyrophosphatase MutT (NUDIX family)
LTSRPRNPADQVAFSTPWFDVVVRPAVDGQPYYMLSLDDYVSVVAVTADGQMLLVRQYRPVVEHETIELPSGHVDAGESPEQAARRELLEETGFVAGSLEHLGTLVPDVGRLTNRMWCYFAGNVAPDAGTPALEEGVVPMAVPIAQALQMAAEGKLGHALNLSVLFLAVARGKIPMDLTR